MNRNVTMDLLNNALWLDDLVVVSVSRTPYGYRWYSSSTNRYGRKDNYPSKEVALRAAARQIGLKII